MKLSVIMVLICSVSLFSYADSSKAVNNRIEAVLTTRDSSINVIAQKPRRWRYPV